MEKRVIIFDGECNLCNGVVSWLFDMARPSLFEFVAFQSQRGQNLLALHGMPTDRLETVVLLDQREIYTHSDGFLRIIHQIPSMRKIAKMLAYIPKPFRDTVYRMAAKNRLRWFGKSQTCSVAF